MLHFVAQLCKYTVRNILGALGAEVDAHALGTDQFHHLLDFFQQRFGRPVKQQVRFIEEEDHLGFRQIADFRQGFKQFRHHPQQESGIQFSVVDQDFAVQDVDHAPAAVLGQPVRNGKGRFAEEHVGPLGLQCHNGADDGRNGRRAHLAIFRFKFNAVLIDKIKHGLQVFGIDQQQLVIVRDFVHNI